MKDVIDAWRARCAAVDSIRATEDHYRETLRAAISDGVPQVDISKALDRTREMIRRDAMTDEERSELKRRAAERERERRKVPKK